jgi:hypothetical protein
MNSMGFHGDLEIYIGIVDDFLGIYWGFTGDFYQRVYHKTYQSFSTTEGNE